MKLRILYIFIFIAMFATACKEQPHHQQLDDVEARAFTAPGEALGVLDSLRPLLQSDADVMRARLARIMILDKLDALTEDALTEINELNEYFQHHDDLDHRIKAIYYLGRVNREQGDVKLAGEYFTQLVDEVNAHSEPSQEMLYFKNKSYSQLGSIYLYQQLPTVACDMYHKSLEVATQRADTMSVIFNLRDLANAHYTMNNVDSCSAYCHRALKIIGNNETYNYFRLELNCILVALMVETNQLTIAHQHLLQATHQPVVDGKDIQTIPAVLEAEASYYHAAKQWDKCIEVASTMLSLPDVRNRIKAAGFLIDAYIALGNHSEVAKMSLLFQELSDTLNVERRTEALVRMNAIYNYEQREKENARLKEKVFTFRLWLILLSLALIVLITIYIYIRYVRQRHSMMRLRHSYKEQLSQEKAKKAVVDTDNEISRIKSSEIYNEITRLVSTTAEQTPLKQSQWDSLAAEVNAVYADFDRRLFDICNVNIHEYHVSLLIKIGIAPSKIATLTAHSKESITACRRRLYEKAFGKKGAPKDWDKFIATL